MNELEDDLRALLEAERRAPLREDLPEIRVRVRKKVLARVHGGWGPLGPGALGLAVGLGLGGLLSAWLAEPPAAILVPVPVPVTVPAPVAPLEPPRARPVRSEPVPEPVPEPTAPPEPTGERALVERARVALLRGDPQEALVTMMGHERQFPQGTLTEERDVLVIEALMALGRRDEAVVRANAFRARYPRSVHLPLLPR